jgi:archaellum component FlaC
MSDILRLLKEIRDELREIKLLYKELVEKLIPVEEPLENEKKAIEVIDEVVSEDEMMKTLKTDTSD